MKKKSVPKQCDLQIEQVKTAMAANGDAVPSGEPTADVEETVDSEQPESERSLTGEEILAAQEEEESESLDAEVVTLMQNPTVKEVTPLAKGALAKQIECVIELVMYIARVVTAIDEKSFRVWVKKVLQMDEKFAYTLRSIGTVFWPLVVQGLVTHTYLASLGISRLLTIVRFPEGTWSLNEIGQVLVKDGETKRHIADMSVDELRKLLATIKAAQTEQPSTLDLLLQSIEEKCALSMGLLCDYEREVAPIKETLHPKVQDWAANIDKAIAAIKLKEKALLDEYRKNADKLKKRELALGAKRRKAFWWLDLLEGRGNDLPAEFQANSAKIIEDAADIERRKAAETVAKLARQGN